MTKYRKQALSAQLIRLQKPSPINDETMPEQQPSFAVRNFFETAYKKMYGFDPQEALKAKREAEQREAAARREAEQREAAARREAEQRERERIIFALNQTSKMPAGEIAAVLNVTVEYVESVIQRALAEQAATAETPGNTVPGKGKTPRRPAAGKRGKNT